MMEVANVELGFWGILACCYSWAEVGSEGWTLDLPLDLVQCSHLLCEHFPTDPRLFWMQFPPCWDRTKWSHTDILSVSLWSWWLGFQARNDNHLEKCKWEPWSHISEANSIQVFPLKHWIFYFFFSPPKKRYWLKLSKPLYKMMPEYSPLALLFAAFNEGKSEPTKARVSIAEDTIALAVPALGPQPGCAPSWCREIEDKGSVSKAMNTYI